jgi:anti-sigma regulatory factor (Ser/Thr protein kinase)
MEDNEPTEDLAFIELAPSPSSSSWARRFAASVLRTWQVQQEAIETAELLVSELMTNAIQASCSVMGTVPDPTPRISLTIRRPAGLVVIEVLDHDPNPPVMHDTGPDGESGRGLMLVQALSKEWGHQYRASGGKTVYAVIDAPNGTCDPSMALEEQAS